MSNDKQQRGRFEQIFLPAKLIVGLQDFYVKLRTLNVSYLDKCQMSIIKVAMSGVILSVHDQFLEQYYKHLQCYHAHLTP